MNFHIKTDHKLIVPLFSNKNLNKLPPRIQRFRMKLMRFKYTISHVSGKELIIPNTFSLAPQQEVTQQDNVLHQEAIEFVNIAIDSLPALVGCLKEIRSHQENDTIC